MKGSPVDVHDKLDEITLLVENARSMPMSASCIVHRGELLGMLDEMRALLPREFEQARAVLAERDAMVEQSHDEARVIVDGALAERDRLLSDHEIVLAARDEARRMVEQSQTEAEQLRREVDDYVDTKLAQFEVMLGKVLTQVQNGRDRLRSRLEDALSAEDAGDRDDPYAGFDDADADDLPAGDLHDDVHRGRTRPA